MKISTTNFSIMQVDFLRDRFHSNLELKLFTYKQKLFPILFWMTFYFTFIAIFELKISSIKCYISILMKIEKYTNTTIVYSQIYHTSLDIILCISFSLYWEDNSYKLCHKYPNP